MFGDSFCKIEAGRPVLPSEIQTFNPHVWGLFLQAVCLLYLGGWGFTLSIPMFGDSFCKPTGFRANAIVPFVLSIPMFGDSFCKLARQVGLSEDFAKLSIPMFGDSFCK